MARTARYKSETGFYHVMMRGINKQDIFFDDTDRDKFLEYMRSAISHPINLSGRPSGQFKVFAYALMGNHFHLLLKVESGEASEFVKKIASGYVRYFNKRHNRDGHLFKERFRSEPCETFNYFCILMGYIHQNPVKHGFSKCIEEYRYTSWREYFAPESVARKVCDVDAVFEKMNIDKLAEVINEMVPRNEKCIDIDKSHGQISDKNIIDYLQEKYSITDPFDIKGYERSRRNEIIKDLIDFGAVVRQISRLTGIDKSTISRQK